MRDIITVTKISVSFVTVIMSLIAYLLLLLYTRRLKKRDDEDALARMQAFLGDASHELRTPLTVIKGYVEMLSKGMMIEEGDKTRAFSRVTSEIGRMESLIKDLLLLAELGESGNRVVETIDLSEITQAHANDFVVLNPNRKVALSIAAEIEVDVVPEYVLRFLQNALNNIQIHTDANAPVNISLSKHGKFATLTIEDGGPGLQKVRTRSESNRSIDLISLALAKMVDLD